VLLFHGTKANTISYITQQGFEERIANDAGMFGAGIYFAENSSKSDEYVTPDPNDLCYFFLSRICLGYCYSTKKVLQKLRRPPCIEGHIDNCLHKRADSVLAECKRTGQDPKASYFLERYQEFIIYDRSQCYPEFLITFKRVNKQDPD